MILTNPVPIMFIILCTIVPMPTTAVLNSVNISAIIDPIPRMNVVPILNIPSTVLRRPLNKRGNENAAMPPPKSPPNNFPNKLLKKLLSL